MREEGYLVKRRKMWENEKTSGERRDTGGWEISGERGDLG